MTLVTVHSNITGQPVPGGTWDTDTESVSAVIARALTFSEVRNAPLQDRAAAENLLRELAAGRYPFRGDIRDARLTAHGISHFTVTDNTQAPVEPAPVAGENMTDAEVDAEFALLTDDEDGDDTPVYSEALAVQSGVTPEAREYLATLETSPAKSTPADFKLAGLAPRVAAALAGVAGLVVGAVAGGLIF